MVSCDDSPTRQIQANRSGPAIRPNQPRFAMASSSQDVVTPQPRTARATGKPPQSRKLHKATVYRATMYGEPAWWRQTEDSAAGTPVWGRLGMQFGIKRRTDDMIAPVVEPDVVILLGKVDGPVIADLALVREGEKKERRQKQRPGEK